MYLNPFEYICSAWDDNGLYKREKHQVKAVLVHLERRWSNLVLCEMVKKLLLWLSLAHYGNGTNTMEWVIECFHANTTGQRHHGEPLQL